MVSASILTYMDEDRVPYELIGQLVVKFAFLEMTCGLLVAAFQKDGDWPAAKRHAGSLSALQISRALRAGLREYPSEELFGDAWGSIDQIADQIEALSLSRNSIVHGIWDDDYRHQQRGAVRVREWFDADPNESVPHLPAEQLPSLIAEIGGISDRVLDLVDIVTGARLARRERPR